MSEVTLTAATDALLDQASVLAKRLSAVRAEIAKRIFGQDRVIEETLVTLLSGGHGLLVGVPGLGLFNGIKTMRGFKAGMTKQERMEVHRNNLLAIMLHDEMQIGRAHV